MKTAENYYNCSYLLCPFGQSFYHPLACLLNHTEQKPILVLKQYMGVIKFLKYIQRQISLTIKKNKQTIKIWLCKVHSQGWMGNNNNNNNLLLLLLLRCLHLHVRCLVIKTLSYHSSSSVFSHVLPSLLPLPTLRGYNNLAEIPRKFLKL